MCGGKGTRLESDREKPLYPIDGVAMVDRVVTALARSRIDAIYAAVSPNAPETRDHLRACDGPVTTINTAGDGYVADLLSVLDRPAVTTPILTVAADLPLLDAAIVEEVLTVYDDRGHAGSLTVCVPETCKRQLGTSIDSRLDTATSPDELVPTGVNVVDATANDSTTESMTYVTDDPRLAINVNRREDARIATERIRRSTDR
ncbi:NTP transferase domain-containing protein [Natrialba sp. PRR66]|uniref:NTP transferase domain-containing protein n=1 Tax=Natrialba sp. PRR66 TaxID=3098146 RepID=UPI002B1D9658|nr:NTP transferase domain-containing protein [Natrialba sp. PRR66]